MSEPSMSICGDSVDHIERLTYEDAEVQQWECERCGAEWYEDKAAE